MARPENLKKALPGLLRFLHFVSPKLAARRMLIAGSLLLLLAEIALRLLEPWPIKFIIDQVVATGRGETIAIPFLGDLDPVTLVTLMCGAIVIITWSRALACYGNTVGFALVGNQVLTEISNDLYRHLQRLSLTFHSRARSGDLVVRAINDVGMLKDMAVTAILPSMANLLILMGMLGVMAWVNWQLALIALATVPLFSLFALHRTRRIQAIARKQRRHEGALASTTVQSIVAIKVIQALSLQEAFEDEFSSGNKKSLKQGVKAARLTASLERSVDVLMALAAALVLWWGAHLVMAQEISTGDLLVFLFYLKGAFKLLQNFAKYTARIAKASAAGERVLELLEKEPDVRDQPGAIAAPPFLGAVQFVNVGFAYEAGHAVLKDINLQANGGQRVAVVGSSGTGKSTLVGLLLRLYDPTYGQVLVDNRDIRCYTVDSLRAQISIVLQDTLLFAASVRDNIAYGATGADQEAVENAARLANAHEFIVALPQGYDTVLGERGATLSSGQRQRIAIARAAIRKAPLLILDEPTAGLDEANEREVMGALERLMVGKTSFLITHNLLYAKRADTIICIKDGRVAECGTHYDLLHANGLYWALYQSQNKAYTLPAEEYRAFAR